MNTSMVKLSKLADINPRLNRGLNKDDSVSFLGMADVNADNGTTTSGEERAYGEVAKGYTQFDNGDLLVAKITPCFENGKIAQVQLRHDQGAGSTEFHVIRPDPDYVDARFLLHFLRNPAVRQTGEMRMIGSGGQRRVPSRFVKDLDVPLLPLNKQREVARILDRVESMRANRREAIARLDELAQSFFNDMFGDPLKNPFEWPKVRFGELIESSPQNGLSPSKSGFVKAKVLTLSAITGDQFDPVSWKMSTFKSEPPPTKSVRASDFLVCRGNGNIDLVGRGYFPGCDMPDATFPDTMFSVTPSRRLTQEYLQFIWSSELVRDQIESLARTTNGTFKINQQALASVRVLVPPVECQQQFDKKVTAVRRVRRQHDAHLAELDALFASLQDRTFREELWTEEAAPVP